MRLVVIKDRYHCAYILQQKNVKNINENSWEIAQVSSEYEIAIIFMLYGFKSL